MRTPCKGSDACSVYVNFEKACITVKYDSLLNKLNQYQVRGLKVTGLKHTKVQGNSTQQLIVFLQKTLLLHMGFQKVLS